MLNLDNIYVITLKAKIERQCDLCFLKINFYFLHGKAEYFFYIPRFHYCKSFEIVKLWQPERFMMRKINPLVECWNF